MFLVIVIINSIFLLKIALIDSLFGAMSISIQQEIFADLKSILFLAFFIVSLDLEEFQKKEQIYHKNRAYFFQGYLDKQQFTFSA